MKPGFVNTGRVVKPFTRWRPIESGRNAGRLEVGIRVGTKSGPRDRKIIVHPNQIRRMPS